MTSVNRSERKRRVGLESHLLIIDCFFLLLRMIWARGLRGQKSLSKEKRKNGPGSRRDTFLDFKEGKVRGAGGVFLTTGSVVRLLKTEQVTRDRDEGGRLKKSWLVRKKHTAVWKKS